MKKTEKNGIIILLLFAMVMQMIIPNMGLVYADEGSTVLFGSGGGGVSTTPGAIGTGDIKTVSIRLIFSGSDGKEIARYEDGNLVFSSGKTEIPFDANVEFAFGVEVTDDTTVDTTKEYAFKIAEQIKISAEKTIPIYFDDETNKEPGTKIATATIKEDGTVTFKFEDFINDRDEDRFAWVKSNGKLDASSIGLGGPKKLEFEVEGNKIDIDINFPVIIPTEKITLTKGNNGKGEWQSDGRIKWVINVKAETTPKGRDINNVVITDEIIGTNHTYDSFAAGTGTTYPGDFTYSAGGHVFTFPKIADGETKQIIVYTKPDLSNISSSDEDKDITFENKVSGKFDNYNGGETTIIWKTANATKKINFLDKGDGEFKAGSNREGDVIKWTIKINESKLNMPILTKLTDIFPSTLELVGNVVTSKGGVAFTDGRTISSITNGFEIVFNESFNETITVTYSTKVTTAEATNAYDPDKTSSYTNSATLTWTPSGGTLQTVGDTGTGSIPKTIIEKSKKSYNAGNARELRWTITVNKDKMDIKNPLVVDTLPKNLKFKEAIVSPTNIWKEPVVNESSGEQTIRFEPSSDITITGTYTIEIVASIEDGNKDIYGNNKTTEFANKVRLEGANITTTSTISSPQDYVSEVIEKKAVAYDYTTRKASWQIVVNQNEMTITDTIVTDKIGDYHEFVEGTLYLGSTPLERVYSVEPGLNEYSLTDKLIKINLGTITTKKTIKYETIIPEAKLSEIFAKNKTVILENSATIFGDELITSGVNVTSSKNVESILVNKKSNYTANDDFIDWEVKINQNSVNLGNDVELEDNLISGLILDKQSVKLYNFTVDASNNINLGSEVKDKLVVDYDPASGKVIFKLGEVKTPYILKFRTDVDGVKSTGTFSNSITLRGFSGLSDNSSTSRTVNFNNESSGGGGSKTRGTIIVIKTNEKGEKFANVSFRLTGKGIDQTKITDGNGEILFDNLPMGTYQLKEVSVPLGYKIMTDTITIELKKGLIVDGIDPKNQVINLQNVKIKGNIEIVKQEEGKPGTKLRGATISLYSKDGSFVASGETDGNGKVTFSDLEYGEYYYKEEAAPEGYLRDETEHPFKIENDSSTLKKTLDNVKIKGHFELIKENKSGVKLGGAAISIYTKVGDVPMGSAVTDSTTGKIRIENLPYGEYYYIETSAPNGYMLDTEKHDFTIKDDNVTVEKTLVNEEIKGTIEIEKQDTVGNKLDEAEFGLYYVTDTSFETPIQRETSGTNGKVVFNNVSYNSAGYYVKEIIAPDGYLRYENPILVSVSVLSIDEIKFTPAEIIVKNTKNKGDLEVIKLDLDTKDPLAGAIFELVQGGVVKYTSLETGADGKYTFDGLVHGDYILRESKAPTNYRQSAQTYPVTISGDGKLITIKFENEKQKGTLEVTKIDEKTKKPLKGAEISVYKEEDTKGEHPVASGVTGDDGKVKFELPIGNYYYKETKAPSSYELNKEEYKFSITSDKEEKSVELSNKEIIYIGPGPGPNPPTPPIPPTPNPTPEPEPTPEPKPEIPIVKETTDPEKPVDVTPPNIPENGKKEIVEPPKNGKVEFTEDGKWTYTPNPGFVGKDKFTVKVINEDGEEEEFIIEVDVIPGGPIVLPETGEESPLLLYVLGFMSIASGITILFKKRKEDEEEA